jgi:heme exporter protein C
MTTGRGARAARRALGTAAVVSVALTMVLGLRLPPTKEQHDYSRLIAIHPPIAWVAYLAFGVTALASLLYLVPTTRHRRWDRIAASSAELGLLFTALMLVTGSIWGRPTWGVWWVWDARLTLSALMLALLAGYAALRRVTADVERRAQLSAVAAIAAVVVVPLNHFAVTWWRTLHQSRSLVAISPSSNLDGEYIAVMLLGFVAMTLAYGWLLWQRVRVESAEDEVAQTNLDAAIVERRREGMVVG